MVSKPSPSTIPWGAAVCILPATRPCSACFASCRDVPPSSVSLPVQDLGTPNPSDLPQWLFRNHLSLPAREECTLYSQREVHYNVPFLSLQPLVLQLPCRVDAHGVFASSLYGLSPFVSTLHFFPQGGGRLSTSPAEQAGMHELALSHWGLQGHGGPAHYPSHRLIY